MLSSSHMRGLSQLSIYVPRKYRGDHDDPHYIPKSPLISRQVLTPHEETELRRACEQVLSRVPHGDDMEDDYLLQLARHITVNPREDHQKEEMPVRHQKTITATSDLPTMSVARHSQETATSSTMSDRDISQRTSASTPYTSAGVTPGEGGKKFFDYSDDPAMNPPPVPTKGRARSSSGGANYPFINQGPGASSIRVVLPTTKSISTLPSSRHTHEQFDISLLLPKPNQIGATLTQPAFNKSLPDLPQSGHEQSHDNIAIFNLDKKDQKMYSDSNEATQEPTDVHRSHTAPLEPTTKKRFNLLSIFNKKKRDQP